MVPEPFGTQSARSGHPRVRISPIDSQWGGGWGTDPEWCPRKARPDRRRSYTRRVEERAPGRRLAWSTAIFSLATGLSRVLGLVREIVAAVLLRRRRARSTPSRSPSRCRTSSARSSRTRRSRRRSSPSSASCWRRARGKRAWRVASTLFWLLLLGLGAITALLIVARAAGHRARSAIPAATSSSRSRSRGSCSRSSSCSASPGSSSGSSTATSSSRCRR